MMGEGASGGPGQAAANDGDAGASGGPGAAKAKKEAELKDGEPRRKKDDTELTGGEPGRAGESGASGGPGAAGKNEAGKNEAGKNEAGKAEPGAIGGPGAKKAAAAQDDEELVDPDADRPNFGASGHATDEAEEDDAEDEDESPRVKSSARKKKADRKPVDPAYVTVATMGLAVAALAGMIWLGRGILMDMWPGIAGFYQSVGVEAAKPGDGLRIAESSKRLQRIGGVETLVVRGFISNISDVPKTVPNLRLELYNEKKEVIQDSSLTAPVGILDPNGSVEFEIRMELPQLNLAKGGYGVVWQE